MNSVAAPRLRITVTVYPKARGLALGLTITTAPQLIAQLTPVTLKNAVDYSSIYCRFNGNDILGASIDSVCYAAGVAVNDVIRPSISGPQALRSSECLRNQIRS